MRPLHALITTSTSKSWTVTWNATALATFNAIKEALANASLLSYPKAEAPTCLMTDASDMAVGAVLQQYVDGMWHPISFFTKKMTPAETCYRELLAVYLAIRHFRHLPDVRHFHVLTDHKRTQYSLRSTLSASSPSAGLHFSIHLHHPPRTWVG